MKSLIAPIIVTVIGLGLTAGGIWSFMTEPPRELFWLIVFGIAFLVSGIMSMANIIKKQRNTRGRTGNSNRKLLNRISSGKITSQEKLKSIALDKNRYTPQERAAAVGKLTDQQALKDVVRSGESRTASEAIKKISDQDFLKSIVKTNEGGMAAEAVRLVSDEAFLAEVVRGDSKAFPKLNASVRAEAIRRINDPETLASLRTDIFMCRNPDVSRVWLEKIYKAALDDPKLMQKVSDTAHLVIRSAHADGYQTVGGGHNDSWQRVPHMSSDCHDDSTPWTPAKGPWGEYGYHGDGTTGGRQQHQDTNPLSTWENRFPK